MTPSVYPVVVGQRSPFLKARGLPRQVGTGNNPLANPLKS